MFHVASRNLPLWGLHVREKGALEFMLMFWLRFLSLPILIGRNGKNFLFERFKFKYSLSPVSHFACSASGVTHARVAEYCSITVEYTEARGSEDSLTRNRCESS